VAHWRVKTWDNSNACHCTFHHAANVTHHLMDEKSITGYKKNLLYQQQHSSIETYELYTEIRTFLLAHLQLKQEMPRSYYRTEGRVIIFSCLEHIGGDANVSVIHDLQLASWPQSTAILWLVPSYTAGWRMRMYVSSLPWVILSSAVGETRTHDLSIMSRMPYPLDYCTGRQEEFGFLKLY